MDLQSYRRLLRLGLILIVLSFSLIGADMPSFELPAPEEDQEKETVPTCCYIHSNYQGVCEVVPAEDETCEGILQYLNTPATVGKTYCNSTRIRGGWESVGCSTDGQ
jgi:hypothetical protein